MVQRSCYSGTEVLLQWYRGLVTVVQRSCYSGTEVWLHIKNTETLFQHFLKVFNQTQLQTFSINIMNATKNLFANNGICKVHKGHLEKLQVQCFAHAELSV